MASLWMHGHRKARTWEEHCAQRQRASRGPGATWTQTQRGDYDAGRGMKAVGASSGDRPKESHPGRSLGGQPRRRRFLLAAALAAAILAVGAADASALIVHSRAGKVSYLAGARGAAADQGGVGQEAGGIPRGPRHAVEHQLRPVLGSRRARPPIPPDIRRASTATSKTSPTTAGDCRTPTRCWSSTATAPAKPRRMTRTSAGRSPTPTPTPPTAARRRRSA